jgi:hypothetical protein
VVAVLVVLISIVPVYLAHRLTLEVGGAAAGRAAGVETSIPRPDASSATAEATAIP